MLVSDFEMVANDFNITVANFGPDGLDQTLVIFMAQDLTDGPKEGAIFVITINLVVVNN